jgi:hypothetical protein
MTSPTHIPTAVDPSVNGDGALGTSSKDGFR